MSQRRQWAAWAARVEPVFIVGAARSGTSVLYRSLQAHSAFRPTQHPHLIESHAVRQLRMLRGPADVTASDVRHLASYVMGEEALTAVARDVASLRRRRTAVRAAAGGRKDGLRAWRLAGEQHVVRRYFLEAERRRGAARLVEKTPSNLEWAAHLRCAFPRAHLLYIVRRPVDALASYWRRFHIDPRHPTWANIPAERYCELWHRETSRALALRDEDPRFFLLRYEDLVDRTEDTVRRVLDAVGEPFEAACLLREPNTDVGPPRRAFPRLYEPLQPSEGDSSEYVDDQTARLVEQRLRSVMQQLEYEPRTG